jgi:uncharacterized protein
MKNLLVLTLLFFSFAMFSQTLREEISSSTLAEKREIKIKLPASFETSKDRKYPVILVLDSEYLFGPFEGDIAYGNYWDDIPEVILVGINENQHNERMADTEFDGETGLPIKKGGAFFEFIGGELLPYLESKYRASSFKIIAGLDSTATLANAFLLKGNPLFKAYISLSPELAKNMEIRIPQRLQQIKEPIFYYQATADGDLKQFHKDIILLDKNIQSIKNDLINYKFEDFKGATHYSLVTHAIPSALDQIFEAYKPISTTEYQEKIVTLKEGYVDYLNKKYENIEKILGTKINVRLNDFKAIEAAILKNEAWNEYEQLAQISGQQYPKSMMYDYHMGMYYEKRGDIKRAIKNYQNGYSKDEIGDLAKVNMLNRAEDLKRLLPKKGLKAGKVKEVEENLDPLPTEETPTPDTPVEEKKP